MALSDAASYAVAHWALDESSGTRADSIGSQDLADNNTVGVATGKFGNGADFEQSNSEYLSASDSAELSFGDEDFCIRFWVKFETVGANTQYLLSKYNQTGAKEYLCYHSAVSNRFGFIVSSDGTATQSVLANNFGVASTGVWYLVHCWHDSAANQIGISINAGTADTQSHSAGVNDGAVDFRLGSAVNLPAANHLDGVLDDVVLLDGYILDATERTEDYNSGTGVAFADWAGGGPTYELEQSSAAAITIADNDATLAVSRKLTVTAPAAIAVATNNATLAAARQITATAPAALAVTTNNAGLAAVRQLSVTAPAAISLTTLDADLTYNASGATYTLSQSTPAAIAVAGLDASLAVGRQIAAGVGALSVESNDAALARSYPITVSDAGAIAVAGLSSSLAAARQVIASAAAISLTGRTASLSYSGAPDESTTIANGNVAPVKAPQNYQAALAPQNYAAAAAPQNWAAVKVSQ